MKRMILVGALVLGTSICSQSYGFDLLDRMLGVRGSGYSSSCCEAPICDTGCEPVCGADFADCGAAPCGAACGEPACGCEVPYGASGFEAACGAEVISDCGCAPAGHHCGGLLDRLFGGLRGPGAHGCDSGLGLGLGLGGHGHHATCGCETVCEPECGFETACCGTGRPRLLDRLFGHRGCDIACDAAPCGCGSAPVSAPVGVEFEGDAPMPPAPVVDPSASLQSKRRVIQASSRYVR